MVEKEIELGQYRRPPEVVDFLDYPKTMLLNVRVYRSLNGVIKSRFVYQPLVARAFP